MKASELRIGNWVNNNPRDGVITVFSNDKCVIRHKAGIDRAFIEKLEPIPLTEEWLLKFGFKKNDNNQFILMEGSVDILFNKDLNGWTCDGINFSINMTEYVHQLQNLYFALTGEELIILS
jgi:hypothetical protein